MLLYLSEVDIFLYNWSWIILVKSNILDEYTFIIVIQTRLAKIVLLITSIYVSCWVQLFWPIPTDNKEK